MNTAPEAEEAIYLWNYHTIIHFYLASAGCGGFSKYKHNLVYFSCRSTPSFSRPVTLHERAVRFMHKSSCWVALHWLLIVRIHEQGKTSFLVNPVRRKSM